MSIHPGKFITFEGLDGCGKTTQIEKLAEALRSAGHKVIVTREPGGTPIGEKVRSIILDSRTSGMSALTEVALMFASRAQQIHEVILPAIRAGQYVLCDRFTDSSEAYQGGGRKLGSKTILAVHQLLCGGLQPDLTILLLSDLNASIGRARNRNERSRTEHSDEGRFETEDFEFFQRVFRAYLAIAEREPERVVKIEATQPIAAVHERVLDLIHTRFQPAKTAR